MGLDLQLFPTKEQPDCHRAYIRVNTNSRTFTAGCCCFENYCGFDYGFSPWDFYSGKSLDCDGEALRSLTTRLIGIIYNSIL